MNVNFKILLIMPPRKIEQSSYVLVGIYFDNLLPHASPRTLPGPRIYSILVASTTNAAPLETSWRNSEEFLVVALFFFTKGYALEAGC